MCRTVGYRASLLPDCKNNTTLRHGNPHPTVNLISNTNSGEPCFVSDRCFILFCVDMVEVGTFPLVDPLSAIIRCFHLYSKVCMLLRRGLYKKYSKMRLCLFNKFVFLRTLALEGCRMCCS